MNERIRELAIEAESYANSKIHMTGWNYREEYNKKFAELIVRECVDIVAAGGEFASRPKLVEKLQEHFGVE